MTSDQWKLSFKVLHTPSAAGADAQLSLPICVSWSTWFRPTKPGSGLNVKANKSSGMSRAEHIYSTFKFTYNDSNLSVLPHFLSLLCQLHVYVKLLKSIVFPKPAGTLLVLFPHMQILIQSSANSHRALPAHQTPFALKCVIVWLNRIIT